MSNRRWLARLILEKIFEIMAAIGAYLAARWLLELSSPRDDWRDVQRWSVLPFDLSWYRGREYWHQVRGRRILWQALRSTGS